MIAELPRYRESTLLSAREKAAVRYAEVLAGDHRQAGEQLFAELREHFTEPEIVDLGWRIVTFVGYGRLISALGLEIGQACPLSTHGDGSNGGAVHEAPGVLGC